MSDNIISKSVSFNKKYAGKKYNRLTILEWIETNAARKSKFKCQCDCGTILTARLDHIVGGHTQSCGCLIYDVNETLHMKHGHSRRNITQPEYYSFKGMHSRCYNPKDPKYKDYGARGITICDRWLHNYIAFFEDMGERPEPKHLYSIDRIDVDGNYEPSNCKWSTRKEQQNNRRITNNKKRVLVICQHCSKELWVEPYLADKKKFCDRDCQYGRKPLP